KLKGPRLIHVITKKGKGYKYAEAMPTDYHGIAPFDIETGEAIRQEDQDAKQETYTQVFGRTIADLAKQDPAIVAVTAAMRDGTGLARFAKEFPKRCFDVGIAEEHAVTFAASLARGGMKPVVAIYSTFLQRAYDQIIHDVSLQNLPVIFCIDRAGLVGEDGPTHHGMFDIAYLRHIPNIVVMAPRDGMELEKMLQWAMGRKQAVAIRYPKAAVYSHIPASTFHPIQLGVSETIREGRDLAIVAIGSMVSTAVKIADLLSEDRIEATVVNARFVKPLDGAMLERLAAKIKKIVTIEEGVADGGFGSALLEFMERENIKGVTVKRIGLPDQFIEHGRREELFKKYHLTADEVSQTIKRELFDR
ncbi:MAG: transketolase C-terminal domain-containing protein, partial [Candidatus Omnitrophica bacterium]|nr:transketolase C-terminal domain-containing protein [Candidatus Omnitrophota bacterium]